MSDKPMATFRIGSVKAVVWKNSAFYNVNIIRAYKDAEGQWKDGNSFNHSDLLNAAECFRKAEAFISEQVNND